MIITRILKDQSKPPTGRNPHPLNHQQVWWASLLQSQKQPLSRLLIVARLLHCQAAKNLTILRFRLLRLLIRLIQISTTVNNIIPTQLVPWIILLLKLMLEERFWNLLIRCLITRYKIEKLWRLFYLRIRHWVTVFPT